MSCAIQLNTFIDNFIEHVCKPWIKAVTCEMFIVTIFIIHTQYRNHLYFTFTFVAKLYQ